MVVKITMPSDEPIDRSWLITEAKRKRISGNIIAVLEQLKELKAVVSSGVLRRSVMGFDQLNRLNAHSGGSSEKSLFDRFTEFFQSGSYWKNFEEMLALAEQFRQRIIYSGDAADDLDGSMNGAAASGGLLSRMLSGVQLSAQNMAGSAALVSQQLDQLGVELFGVGAAAEESGDWVKRAWGPMSTWFSNTVFAPIRSNINSLWDGLEPEAQQSLGAVKNLFSDAGAQLAHTLSSAWEQVQGVFYRGGPVFDGLTDGVLGGFRKMVNSLIDGINQVIVEPFSGINNLFSGLKDFSIGSLKPFKNLSFSISMPSIPYLAQGAVLPANKPFMAVVGDQKHGTNIEAPLELIQSAVAEVMAESVDAQLAGHSATVEVLKQILEAVLGISLDDGTVARAVMRHQQRLAVMEGGF